jgi:membrane-bound lytic murein transglycosylase B
MTDVKLLMIPVVLMMIALSPNTASANDCDQLYWCRKAGKSPVLLNLLNKIEMSRYRADGYKCRGLGKTNCRRSSSSVKSKSNRRRPARRYHRNPSTKAAPTRVTGPAGEASSFEPYIQEAASRYNVPADLVRAVIRVESNFHLVP